MSLFSHKQLCDIFVIIGRGSTKLVKRLLNQGVMSTYGVWSIQPGSAIESISGAVNLLFWT